MQVLFIQGPEKTATSTLTGILNCHPDIFVLFENYLSQPYITKYGNQLLDRYPGARQFFRTEEDYGKPVLDFFQFLQNFEPDYKYEYVGTKINSLDPELTQKVTNHKIIFTKRDVRSWLVKQPIIDRYRTDLDVVIPTVEYLRFIIKSTRHQHAFHLWMEDLIKKKRKTIDDLSEYLDINLQPHTDQWWEKIYKWSDDNPKSAFQLNDVHHSSRKKPTKLDTEYELKKHQFWTEVSGVFEKYVQSGDSLHIKESDVQNDLQIVDKLNKYAPLPLREAYSNIRSLRLGTSEPKEVYFFSETDKEGNKRSLMNRIIERIRRIIDIGFNNYHISKGIAYGLIFCDEIQLLFDILIIE